MIQNINYRSWYGIFLLALGCLFSFLGFISLLDGLAALYFSHTFFWLTFVYSGLNFVVAYGLFYLRKWLIPMMIANVLSEVALIGILVFHGGDDLATRIVFSILGIILCVVLFSIRKKLIGAYFDSIATTLFVVFWLIEIGYNVKVMLHF